MPIMAIPMTSSTDPVPNVEERCRFCWIPWCSPSSWTQAAPVPFCGDSAVGRQASNYARRQPVCWHVQHVWVHHWTRHPDGIVWPVIRKRVRVRVHVPAQPASNAMGFPQTHAHTPSGLNWFKTQLHAHRHDRKLIRTHAPTHPRA